MELRWSIFLGKLHTSSGLLFFVYTYFEMNDSCDVRIINSGFVSFFGLKIQGLSRIYFPFFKDSTHCKINRYYDRFYMFFTIRCCYVSASSIYFHTLESMLDEISYKFQGLSSTDYNFQELSRSSIFILKFKDFQGLSRRVRTLNYSS